MNTPTLTTSEEHRAPWNDKENPPIKMDVTVSVTLSKTVQIETDQYGIRTDGSIYTNEEDLKKEVSMQIDLPQDKFSNWCVDDFAVVME